MTCIQFVYYVLLTSLPIYFATILKFNLQKVFSLLVFRMNQSKIIFAFVEWIYVCYSLYIYDDCYCYKWSIS